MADFIKIIGVFALIVILLRAKIPLYQAMLAAVIAMGILFSIHPMTLLITAAKSSIHPTTIQLAGALTLIMFLENIMRKNGMMEQMVSSLMGLVGDTRVVMAMLPALVGLLPSAGGAVFSAPMVEQVGKNTELSAEKKSFINYWYRHVWEYVFPLYPSIILSAQVTGIPIYRLVTAMIPYAVSSALIGIPVAFFREKKPEPFQGDRSRSACWACFAGSIYPVVMVIILVLLLKWEITWSVGSVVLLLLVVHRYDRKRFTQLVREAFSIPIILMVLAVIIFKDVLLVTGAVESLPVFFTQIGLPSEIIVVALPFAVGMATGMAQAYVGTTFPILLGLSANGVQVHMVALAFVSGFMGVMLSPVHLCLVLTVQVFKAELGKVYRMLLLPSAFQMILALIIYFLMT